LVEFLIVNLLQNFDQSVSRGERFGEVHVKNGWGNVEVSQPRDQYGTPGAPGQGVATFRNIRASYQCHQVL
jgi:hypothetical protein